MATNFGTNLRSNTLTVDKYGIDPLKNKVAVAISQVNAYVLYNVNKSERGRPDLIAYNKYGDTNYWWIILMYNGLISFKELKEGITIKVPDFSQISKILSDQATQVYSKNIRKVSI